MKAFFLAGPALAIFASAAVDAAPPSPSKARTVELIAMTAPAAAPVATLGGRDLFITYPGGHGHDVALYTTAAAPLQGDFNYDGIVNAKSGRMRDQILAKMASLQDAAIKKAAS